MKYVIFDMDNISDVNFAKILETSEETLRLSLDKSKTVLKFTGKTPNFLVGLQTYTHTVYTFIHTCIRTCIQHANMHANKQTYISVI